MSAVKAERYAEYKDSGIEWLGLFPKHWIVCKLKDIAFYQEGPGIMADDFRDEGVPLIRISGMKGEVVSLDGCNFLDPEKVKKKWSHFQLKQGELLVSASATTGVAAKVSEEIVGAIPYTGLIKFKPRKKLKLEYLRYFLTANIFTDQIDLQKSGTTIQHYGPTHLGRVLAVLAPREEQTAISAYLDTKTAQIDRQIDLLGQKATQYGKLKQSLINETVTHGLDKSVPMKDSGVEWIGEVPQQWEVKRLKDLFTERSQKGCPDEPLLIASQTLGVTLKSSYSRNTMTVQDDFHLMKLVKKNDFVISLRSFEGGIEMATHRGIISAAYTILFSIDLIDVRFYKHLFKSTIFISLLVTCTTGIREGRNVNYQQLKRELLPLPSLQEQTSIATFLDEKTAQIDRIVTAINTQIGKLKDLRKALVNDVVTGKIKVVSEGAAV